MKKHITAFYLETLAMILVFVTVILILTAAFGAARAQSVQAAHLTHAVRLAENAAEAVAASGSREELQTLLGSVYDTRRTDTGLSVSDGDYRAAITWEPEDSLVWSSITVFWMDREVYSLRTSRYAG